MREDICLEMIHAVVDSQKDLIVVFKDNKPVEINDAFKRFFAVSSVEEYRENFGQFVQNFVPHPSYFNAEKIPKGSNWVDALLELPEMERMISMVTPSYEPHAFAIGLQRVEEYVVAVLEDITQTLIKRIMIENNANIDIKSGVYAKNYFMQIAQSYQDAALFNKKIIGAVLIQATKKDGTQIKSDEAVLKAFVNCFKHVIRQDDMLIRWDDDAFLLLYLVDTAANAKVMSGKLEQISKKEEIKDVEYTLKQFVQKEGEEIEVFIGRVEV